MVRYEANFTSDFFIYVRQVGRLLSTSATAVGGRAEEDCSGGGSLLWKPNWHELDTEGLLAWCGNIHVMLQPNWGIARLECR